MQIRKIKMINTAKSDSRNISFFSAVIIIGGGGPDMLNSGPEYEIKKCLRFSKILDEWKILFFSHFFISDILVYRQVKPQTPEDQ